MKKPPGHKQWPCSWSESAHGLYSVMPTALCACRTSHLSLHILQKTSWATQKNQFPICGHRQASYSSASLRTLGTMPLCYPAPASLFFTFATALSEDPWPPFVSGAPWWRLPLLGISECLRFHLDMEIAPDCVAQPGLPFLVSGDSLASVSQVLWWYRSAGMLVKNRFEQSLFLNICQHWQTQFPHKKTKTNRLDT